jgi:hypothetical protein
LEIKDGAYGKFYNLRLKPARKTQRQPEADLEVPSSLIP